MPSDVMKLRARRLRRELARISWITVASLLLLVAALAIAQWGERPVVAVVLALTAVACAILSLKET